MNRTFSRIALVFICTFPMLTSVAQLNAPYEMMVNGVKVIVQPSGNEIVVIQTVIKGGVQNYAAGKDGIENLAIDALTECGTLHDDKNSFKNKLNKVDANISGNSAMDFASITLNCLKDDFEQVWPLYTDALVNPAFNTKEFDRIKQVAINRLREQASDPGQAIAQLARRTAWAGKDYAKIPEGTQETIAKLTVEETKAYYKTILTRSKMIIVVVGEIDKQNLEKKISGLLASVPQGQPFTLKKDQFTVKANSFVAQKRDFATNYIQGVSSAPQPGSQDFNAFVLAMEIFFDRQFLEVRTNNGLSYAPQSYFSGGLYPSSNILVSTTDPNKYIGVMNNLLNTVHKEGFAEADLKNQKSTYITAYYSRLETNAAQASALAGNEVLHNNWRRAITINEQMKNITTADLNRVFNKYVTNFSWVYLGDPAKVDAALYSDAKTGKPKTAAPVLKVDKKN